MLTSDTVLIIIASVGGAVILAIIVGLLVEIRRYNLPPKQPRNGTEDWRLRRILKRERK